MSISLTMSKDGIPTPPKFEYFENTQDYPKIESMNIFIQPYFKYTLAAFSTTVTLLAALFSAPLQAAPIEGISPGTVKKIRAANADYKECQQAAITALNSKLINQVKFKAAIDTCRERFPAISLYGKCKRKALKSANSGKGKPAAALEECKKLLVAASFDKDQPIPFFTREKQLFFAGVGLNKSSSAVILDPPNFDCDRLNKALVNPLEAQYILFGNHPKMFSSLENLSGDDLARAMRLDSVTRGTRKNGVGTKDFGRIFGNLESRNATVFFPTAACDFDGQLGKLFSGLSAYYLLDKKSGEVTPYFGIAHYRPRISSISTKTLVSQLIATLNEGGSGYKAVIKNDTTAFVTNAAFTEYDDEKDPRNLCKAPREHSLLGIVQAAKENPARPRYLVVANITNLCEYGDRLAARLVEEFTGQ